MATRGFEGVTLADLGMRAVPKPPVRRPRVPQERRSKYRAVRCEVDGIVFHSKAEGARYVYLKILGSRGLIRNLELQPRFPLRVGDVLIGAYVADFRYELREFNHVGESSWADVIEDVKGFKTPVYKLKKKLVEALYGITVTERP